MIFYYVFHNVYHHLRLITGKFFAAYGIYLNAFFHSICTFCLFDNVSLYIGRSLFFFLYRFFRHGSFYVYRIGCFYSFAFFCFALLNRKFTENGAIFALYCVVDTGNESVTAFINTMLDRCQFFQHTGKFLR